MEKYILETFCKMGKFSEAQDRMKTQYDAMINNVGYSSTLWEYWDYRDGSKNHAWAGGPLVIMSKYFAGIMPYKPGYEEILIKPEFGNLTSIKANVSTIKGNVEVVLNKKDTHISYEINVPEKTIIYVDKMEEDTVSIDGVEVESKNYEGDKVVLTLDKGKYNIISK